MCSLFTGNLIPMHFFSLRAHSDDSFHFRLAHETFACCLFFFLHLTDPTFTPEWRDFHVVLLVATTYFYMCFFVCRYTHLLNNGYLMMLFLGFVGYFFNFQVFLRAQTWKVKMIWSSIIRTQETHLSPVVGNPSVMEVFSSHCWQNKHLLLCELVHKLTASWWLSQMSKQQRWNGTQWISCHQNSIL